MARTTSSAGTTKRRSKNQTPPTKSEDTGSDSLYLNQLRFDEKTLKSPIKVLLDNTRLLFLLILVILSAGIYSYLTLPRELNPEVEIPIVQVTTVLPGADPLDVEELVTKPLETEIENITTISNLSSISSEGISNISVEFESNVDPDDALVDVKEKVDLVTSDLPTDASDPNVVKLDFNDQPVWSVALVGDIDSRSISRIANILEEQLESVAGIRKVDLSGDEMDQIVVELKPEAIVEYGIDPSTIISGIQSTNVTAPAGSLTINQTKYQVSLDDELNTIDQVREIQLNDRFGNLVELGEIATVFFQSEDTDRFTTYINGQDQVLKNAIQLDIFKSDSETISGAVDKARLTLEEELKSYPQVELVSIIDFSQDIDEQFEELGSNFASTIFLVFVTLFLFIGFRQAAIASLSIPLTFLSAFAIMSVVGISINFLSLFSLLLALGLVVDDAIVIVQAMHRYSYRFKPKETGLMVYRDFVVPIWTTTLTTVWAFLPLLLATGIIGEFIKSIPIVVTATLMSSTTIAVLINLPLATLFSDLQMPPRVRSFLWFIGFLLVLAGLMAVGGSSPFSGLLLLSWTILALLLVFSRNQVRGLLARLSQPTKNSNGKAAEAQARFSKRLRQLRRMDVMNSGVLDFSAVSKRYRRFLKAVITKPRNRILVYLTTVIFFVTSMAFLATGLLKSEFFPKTDQESIYVNVEGPAGWTIEQTQAVLREVEREIISIPEISHLVSQTGSLAPLDFGTIGQGSHLAFVTITLPREEDREQTSIEIAEEIRTRFEGESKVKITVFEVSGGPPAGADLQVNIKGNDLAVLEEISDEFQAVLETMPEAINVDTSLKQSAGKIAIQLNERELVKRGLDDQTVAGWLQASVDGINSIQGREVTLDIEGEEDELSVLVTIPESSQTLDLIQNVPITAQTQQGPQQYSLAEIATFDLETSPTTIEREDGIRAVRVTAAANNTSATELLEAFELKVAEAGIELPRGYTWDVGGVNEENQASTNSIIQAMGVSVILILITMVLQLNSFRKSLLVLIVIPLAVAGVFFNFTIAGIPLSFPALIGVLALFGIVVNNSIMLVEKINQNLKFGLPFIDAIVDACSSRIEAIFFTSLTTTIGLLPITISDPLWRGLGGAIIAGLTVSGTLILVLLPTLFVEVYQGEVESAQTKNRTHFKTPSR